jgi:hypothetical protein
VNKKYSVTQTHIVFRVTYTRKKFYKESVAANWQGGMLVFSIPLKPTLNRLVKKFRPKGSLLMGGGGEQQETRRVLSQETLNNTEPWLETSAQKYLGRCKREPVCHTHLHTSTKLFRLNHTNLQFCENSKRLAGLRGYDFVTGSLKQCVLLPSILRRRMILVKRAMLVLKIRNRYWLAENPRCHHKILKLGTVHHQCNKNIRAHLIFGQNTFRQAHCTNFRSNKAQSHTQSIIPTPL